MESVVIALSFIAVVGLFIWLLYSIVCTDGLAVTSCTFLGVAFAFVACALIIYVCRVIP